jgi:hypothetical protein
LLLGVGSWLMGMELVTGGLSRCEFGGGLWRLATFADLVLKRGPISWPKCNGGSPVGGQSVGFCGC